MSDLGQNENDADVDSISSSPVKISWGAKVRKAVLTLFGILVGGFLVLLFLDQFTCKAREAAQRTMSRNNLKQIGLAMHQYHDDYGRFPDAYNTDENGYPLLSWRVHLLPYLDRQKLYDQFKLNEPWHSPHNQKLIAKMPKVYRNPFIESKEPKTNYLLPIVDETLFARGKGKTIAEVEDGTDQTIMAVEANADQSVVWTKPNDLAVDLDAPHEVMTGFWSGENICMVLLADGSVQMMGQNIDKEDLTGLLTDGGGEKYGDDRENLYGL